MESETPTPRDTREKKEVLAEPTPEKREDSQILPCPPVELYRFMRGMFP